MPEKQTLKRAAEDKREGKAPSTQAGEFVREEMDHIREGKHGARNTKQAIAIGLSKARRAGVDLPPPKGSDTSLKTRKQAERDTAKGQAAQKKTAKKQLAKKQGATKKAASTATSRATAAKNTAVNKKRSRATTQALKKEGRSAASHNAISKHSKQVAAKRKKAAK